MTKDNLKQLVALAQTHPGPIAEAVRAAAYGESVHPGLLQEKLRDAGLDGDVVAKTSGRVELRISSGGELLAWANAPNLEEAILHSVLGYLRERETAAARERETAAAS